MKPLHVVFLMLLLLPCVVFAKDKAGAELPCGVTEVDFETGKETPGKPCPPLVDLKAIALKTKPEVEKIIGKAKSCGNSKYGLKCEYKFHGMEITYINGKADWIHIEELDKVRFNQDALASFGLENTPPTFANQNTIRWENSQGFLEIEIFPDSGRVSYAYIRALTQ